MAAKRKRLISQDQKSREPFWPPHRAVILRKSG
jgi:hypothetical protein